MVPGTIICGRTYDYNNLCGPGSKYFEHVQTHEKTSHTMKVRTVGALTLQPSGNRQDAFYYLSLESRRHLYRRRCTPLPMPSNIIDRVHALASKQKVSEGISFLRNDNTLFPTLSPPDNDRHADVIATSEGVNNVGDNVVNDNDDAITTKTLVTEMKVIQRRI